MPFLKKPPRKPRPRRTTARKRAAAQYYALPSYRAARRDLMRRLPWCALCLCNHDPHLTAAVEAHHLRPIQNARSHEARVERAIDARNLMPLCRDCHHAMHTGGYPDGTDPSALMRLMSLLHGGADADTLGVWISHQLMTYGEEF